MGNEGILHWIEETSTGDNGGDLVVLVDRMCKGRLVPGKESGTYE